MPIRDSLPPVAQMLSAEILTNKSFEEAKRYFLDILPELRAQAEWTQANFEYADDNTFKPSSNFVTTPVSGMNPFSPHGKCSDLICRVKNANRFAQTMGLYSDKINIHDPFTTRLLHDDEWSDSEIIGFLADTIVMQELMPLIDKGVIQFLNPSCALCTSCYEEFSHRVDNLAGNILEDFKSGFEVSRLDDGYYIETGMLYEPPITSFLPFASASRKNISKKRILDYHKECIADEIREILMGCHSESVQGSAVFSNSRVALKALRSLEGRAVPNQIEAWELAHSADLPWIKDLSVKQVVQLRDEAENALPQFREQLAINVSSKNATELNDSDSRSAELIRKLRASAEEVTAELHAVNIAGERKFNTVAGTLGLTVAIYGFGADFLGPGAALGTLLSTLGLIHNASKKDEHDVRKISSKPGYVLVRAKDLLSHAD